MPLISDFAVTDIHGNTQSLEPYLGKVLLIVNVASRCGFTSQYSGLQALYTELADQGFAVLGFPCNQFGSQEPGDEATIESFCQTNYGVTFPMFAKVEVNGREAIDLYGWLKSSQPGLLGSEAVKWNFTKFLVDRHGNVVKRYAPNVTPQALRADIEALL
ncbi:MAG: glutathione peroxidase [Orrella sp.]